MSNCYLYFYDGHLSVSPTTISLAKAISTIFDNVIVFCKDTKFDRYSFEEKNIKAIYMNDEYKFFNKKVGRTRFFFGVLKYILKSKITKQDMFVCIDNRPLRYVNSIYKWFKIPFVFLSLELFTNKKYSGAEKNAFKNSKAILIQDTQRLENLLKTFDNTNSNIPYFIVPNVSIGNDKYDKNLTSMVDQFPDLQNKTKCGCIGMISDFVYSKEIAKVFTKINNSVLIYHNRSKIDVNDKYIQEIIKINSENLYLSKKVYNFNDIGYVYDKIDIGIAAYIPEGNGFDYIGHASGKLTFYLKYKKPVIVNKLDGYSEIIEQYNCGIVINDINNAEEWQNAIDTINNNYDFYSRNAYECYLKEFDFMNQISAFLDFSKNISNS